MYVSETRRRHRDTSIIDIDQERDRFRCSSRLPIDAGHILAEEKSGDIGDIQMGIPFPANGCNNTIQVLYACTVSDRSRRKVTLLLREPVERPRFISLALMFSFLRRASSEPNERSSHGVAVATQNDDFADRPRRSPTRPLCIYSKLKDMLIKSVSCPAATASVRACVETIARV